MSLVKADQRWTPIGKLRSLDRIESLEWLAVMPGNNTKTAGPIASKSTHEAHSVKSKLSADFSGPLRSSHRACEILKGFIYHG